ncbi:conserved protein, unknown function [Hepatocystis sp. ex Piliocolobus tephrosceles]|nr:conserved protein, unknown function [Hepatocystis sp. ex Piliocolobus tephrosceles]
MLKIQNASLVKKNKDIINEELEKKLTALNESLINVQAENIELTDKIEQYSKLIKNVKSCTEINYVVEELKNFENCLLI